MTTARKDAPETVLRAFEKRTGLRGIKYELKERTDGDFLLLNVGCPTDRLFTLLEKTLSELPSDSRWHGRVTLRKKSPPVWLVSPEARLLKTVLSESLTVDRYTFKDDFFGRYIPSVFGGESEIVTSGNHLVLGRRGSGKSSLLAYAMRTLMQDDLPFAWIVMQTYEGRGDLATILHVIAEILQQTAEVVPGSILLDETRSKIDKLLQESDAVIKARIPRILPSLRKIYQSVTGEAGSFTVFLDDFHLVSQAVQPELLATLYALSRGNRVSIKVSGIEGFTRTWDPTSRRGLEIPNDARPIRLDYNLTMPDKSKEHITNILDAHARYCGLPSVSVLCPKKAMNRLVWVAAGVPRDAIYLFTQAMVQAVTKGKKSITVTSINQAASEASSDKMRFIEMDASGSQEQLLVALKKIKVFCIEKEKKNAFLLQIKNDDPFYESVRKLVDLRFLHVLHTGITPDRAGERFVALLLDYGFYTGMRAAKTVDLFQKEATTPTAKDLRRLPRFRV